MTARIWTKVEEISVGTNEHCPYFAINIPVEAFKDSPRSFADIDISTEKGKNYLSILQFMFLVMYDRRTRTDDGEKNMESTFFDDRTGNFVKKVSIYFERLNKSEIGITQTVLPDGTKIRRNIYEVILENTSYYSNLDEIEELYKIRRDYILEFSDPVAHSPDVGKYTRSSSGNTSCFTSTDKVKKDNMQCVLKSSWGYIRQELLFEKHYNSEFEATCKTTAFFKGYEEYLVNRGLKDREMTLRRTEETLLDFVADFGDYLIITKSNISNTVIYRNELSRFIKEKLLSSDVSDKEIETSVHKIADLIIMNVFDITLVPPQFVDIINQLLLSRTGHDGSFYTLKSQIYRSSHNKEPSEMQISIDKETLLSDDNFAGVRIWFMADDPLIDIQNHILHQLIINSSQMIERYKLHVRKSGGDVNRVRNVGTKSFTSTLDSFAKDVISTHATRTFTNAEIYTNSAIGGDDDITGDLAVADVPDDDEAAIIEARKRKEDEANANFAQKSMNQFEEVKKIVNEEECIQLQLHELHTYICNINIYYTTVLKTLWGYKLKKQPNQEQNDQSAFSFGSFGSTISEFHIKHFRNNALDQREFFTDPICVSQCRIQNYIGTPLQEYIFSLDETLNLARNSKVPQHNSNSTSSIISNHVTQSDYLESFGEPRDKLPKMPNINDHIGNSRKSHTSSPSINSPSIYDDSESQEENENSGIMDDDNDDDDDDDSISNNHVNRMDRTLDNLERPSIRQPIRREEKITLPFGGYHLEHYESSSWTIMGTLEFPWVKDNKFSKTCSTISYVSKLLPSLEKYFDSEYTIDTNSYYIYRNVQSSLMRDLLDGNCADENDNMVIDSPTVVTNRDNGSEARKRIFNMSRKKTGIENYSNDKRNGNDVKKGRLPHVLQHLPKNVHFNYKGGRITIPSSKFTHQQLIVLHNDSRNCSDSLKELLTVHHNYSSLLKSSDVFKRARAECKDEEYNHLRKLCKNQDVALYTVLSSNFEELNQRLFEDETILVKMGKGVVSNGSQYYYLMKSYLDNSLSLFRKYYDRKGARISIPCTSIGRYIARNSHRSFGVNIPQIDPTMGLSSNALIYLTEGLKQVKLTYNTVQFQLLLEALIGTYSEPKADKEEYGKVLKLNLLISAGPGCGKTTVSEALFDMCINVRFDSSNTTDSVRDKLNYNDHIEFFDEPSPKLIIKGRNCTSHMEPTEVLKKFLTSLTRTSGKNKQGDDGKWVTDPKEFTCNSTTVILTNNEEQLCSKLRTRFYSSHISPVSRETTSPLNSVGNNSIQHTKSPGYSVRSYKKPNNSDGSSHINSDDILDDDNKGFSFDHNGKKPIEQYMIIVQQASFMMLKLMGTRVCPIYPQYGLCDLLCKLALNVIIQVFPTAAGDYRALELNHRRILARTVLDGINRVIHRATYPYYKNVTSNNANNTPIPTFNIKHIQRKLWRNMFSDIDTSIRLAIESKWYIDPTLHKLLCVSAKKYGSYCFVPPPGYTSASAMEYIEKLRRNDYDDESVLENACSLLYKRYPLEYVDYSKPVAGITPTYRERVVGDKKWKDPNYVCLSGITLMELCDNLSKILASTALSTEAIHTIISTGLKKTYVSEVATMILKEEEVYVPSRRKYYPISQVLQNSRGINVLKEEYREYPGTFSNNSMFQPPPPFVSAFGINPLDTNGPSIWNNYKVPINDSQNHQFVSNETRVSRYSSAQQTQDPRFSRKINSSKINQKDQSSFKKNDPTASYDSDTMEEHNTLRGIPNKRRESSIHRNRDDSQIQSESESEQDDLRARAIRDAIVETPEYKEAKRITESVYPKSLAHCDGINVYKHEFPIVEIEYRAIGNSRVKQCCIYILTSFLNSDPDFVKRALVNKFSCFGEKYPRMVATENPHSISDNIRTVIWIEPHPYRVLDVSSVILKYKDVYDLNPGSSMFKLLHRDLMAFFALVHYIDTGGNPDKQEAFLEKYVYSTRPRDLYTLSDTELENVCKVTRDPEIRLEKAKTLKRSIIHYNKKLYNYDKYVEDIFEKGDWQDFRDLSDRLRKVFENPKNHNLDDDRGRKLTHTDLVKYIKYRNAYKKELAVLLSINGFHKPRDILDANRSIAARKSDDILQEISPSPQDIISLRESNPVVQESHKSTKRTKKSSTESAHTKSTRKRAKTRIINTSSNNHKEFAPPEQQYESTAPQKSPHPHKKSSSNSVRTISPGKITDTHSVNHNSDDGDIDDDDIDMIEEMETIRPKKLSTGSNKSIETNNRRSMTGERSKHSDSVVGYQKNDSPSDLGDELLRMDIDSPGNDSDNEYKGTAAHTMPKKSFVTKIKTRIPEPVTETVLIQTESVINNNKSHKHVNTVSESSLTNHGGNSCAQNKTPQTSHTHNSNITQNIPHGTRSNTNGTPVYEIVRRVTGKIAGKRTLQNPKLVPSKKKSLVVTQPSSP